MLSQINRIKKLGLVFSDFTWGNRTPPFNVVNLIYGWNGCGKTTLTRLFDRLASQSGETVEFEVQTADGNKFTQTDPFPLPIRVFNQDYINKNVRVSDSKANAISILLGEQSTELAAQIESDERELNGDPTDATKRGKLLEFDGYTKKKERKERENETAFTDIARTIGAAIAGSSVSARNYRSPDAKRDFIALRAPAVLSEDDLAKSVADLKQEMLPELASVELTPIHVNGTSADPLVLAAQSISTSKALCTQTAEAEAIARLSEHPDIAEWVEQGIALHASHKSVNCEYCGNVISGDRLKQLAKHFSDADRILKAKIEDELSSLRLIHQSIDKFSAHDAMRLYQEFRADYATAVEELGRAREQLKAQVVALGKELQLKKTKTSESMSLIADIGIGSIEKALLAVNALIDKHNAKSREFKVVQDAAIEKIRTHYLSTIYGDVTRRIKEVAELIPDLERRAAEIKEIRTRIAKARVAISSAHKACEQINERLKIFLGHKELRFEPETKSTNDEGGGGEEVVSGYRIMHGDKPAIYLSEGEKTAIAFVYFVVHLNDGQFLKQNGIVVIDDPVSSLDSNSLYQAFSFLKNAVKGCKQVFILTHNFDFLKLLLNWRARQIKKTGYYMIRNHFVGDDRRASIDDMDRELKEYASEYHYLFKRLKEMRAEQDGTIMRAYPVPNMARKAWDSFLLYRVPDGRGTYAKMELLKAEGHDALKLDAIYKFTNDQSHITGSGFDPALVPETQKVLAELFEMMQTLAPEHYAVLDRSTN
jgi:wobble nucleotide-excising tRNase